MSNILLKLSKNIFNIIRRQPAFLFAEILLTYHCTQRCLQCNIPGRASKENIITPNNFRLFIDKLSNYGTHGIVLSGGEPLLHPQIDEFIKYISNVGFLYKHILTNLYISSTKIERITPLLLENNIHVTCSFDGLGNTADVIRGSKNTAQILIQNMEYLDKENKKAGNPIKTSANIVISQLNLHQIPEMLRYLEQLGWMTNVDIYRNSSVNHNHVDHMYIKDQDELNNVFEKVKRSPIIVTPDWLIDGYSDYLNKEFKKQCPYLDSPSLGSKFYVHPNGDIQVCIGKSAGNLYYHSPFQIFSSNMWKEKLKEFENCNGCWNTCYTPAARLSNYFKFKEIKNIINILRN